MPFVEANGVTLYYEFTGPEDGPVIIQFGGGLFGRRNFGMVNDGMRANGFRLLSFDARGYGQSSCPRERYTIAGCSDVAVAKPDTYRKTVFRSWQRMTESMPWDDFSDHVTTQAVGAKFLESKEGTGARWSS